MTNNPSNPPLIVVTRKSPLALAQTNMVMTHLSSVMPGQEFRALKVVTTGDRQLEWSLEDKGGKGLFTGELEKALLSHEADFAVHSSKDLPTDNPEGLTLAGFLPREIPNDVLVLREGVETPSSIATGSPRRRQQLQRLFPQATFMETRGNVGTRLQKIADGQADATVLAAAGLKRLGVENFPGLRFEVLPIEKSVPAVGQAAVAIQCRVEDRVKFASFFDKDTARAGRLERAFLERMGGGCHVAFAAYYREGRIHLFHDSTGYRTVEIEEGEMDAHSDAIAEKILGELKINV
ncbi:MAG: hydroxymethylbilane synthase [Opitutaceae bacterium]|nr:hydroxymethylbilane synthase [Opitutaceae bacterium]